MCVCVLELSYAVFFVLGVSLACIPHPAHTQQRCVPREGELPQLRAGERRCSRRRAVRRYTDGEKGRDNETLSQVVVAEAYV